MRDVSPEVMHKCVADVQKEIDENGLVEDTYLIGLIYQVIYDVKWSAFPRAYRFVLSDRDWLLDADLVNMKNLSATLDVFALCIRTWQRVCCSLNGQDVYVDLFSSLREEYDVLMSIVQAALFKCSQKYMIAYQASYSNIRCLHRDWSECKNRFIRCFSQLVENGVITNDRFGQFVSDYRKYSLRMCNVLKSLRDVH